MLRAQNSDVHQQTATEYRELSHELTHLQFLHQEVTAKFEYWNLTGRTRKATTNHSYNSWSLG